MRLDSKESAFFQRQVEYVKTRTYDTKYKNLKAVTLIPVSTEAPSGAVNIVYRSFSQIGTAKIIADYAKDFPRVDIYGTEETVKVFGIGVSYGYSIPEIRRAAMAGLSLEQRRANTAKRANDEKVDGLAWDGDSDYNIQGLIDYPGITEYTVPAGAASTKTWVTKTPDEIIADMAGIISAVSEATNGREEPNQIILPIAQYRLIKTTRMTDGDSSTILKFFLDNNPGVSVDWVNELDEAGASSTDRFMAYTRDPDHLTLEIPQPFEQFEADKDGMEYVVPCHSECAGVIVYYPTAVAYGDGI